MKFFLLICVSIFTCTFVGAYDLITLKNGSTIVCKIVSSDDRFVSILQNNNGIETSLKIEKSSIKKVAYSGNDTTLQKYSDINQPLNNTTETKDVQSSFFIGRHTFNLSIGLAIPIGNFSGTSIKNNSGYAENGMNINASYTYQYNELLGFTGKLFNSSNSFDTYRFLENFNTISDSIWTLNATKWKTLCFFVGPTIFFQSGNLKLSARLLPGILVLSSPDYNFSTIKNGEKLEVVSGRSTAPGIDIGAGAIYIISNNLGINMDLSYISARFNFNHNKPNLDGQITPLNQSVSLVNISFGISYNFDFK